MDDENKKSDIEFLKNCGIPTKEEFFKRQMGQVKIENNSDWSEKFTEQLLKELSFPAFHKVDGNPIYKPRNAMLTPDFVAGIEPIKANNPEDFYIDVNEITEGVWGNFNDENNKFSHGNSIKEMYRELNDNNFTSDNPYRLLINESQPELIYSLYKQINSKSEKYSSKRNGSDRFGLISVLAKNKFHIAQMQYLKLIISIFEDLLEPFFLKNSTIEACKELRSIKLDFLNPGHKTGFIPICCPFEGNWCFWMIVGTLSYEGNYLFLVNSRVLNNLPIDNPVAIWIKKIAKIHTNI